jgi:hypothetical protein
MAKPFHLKEEGNRRFQAGDYVMAEALYSQAYGAPPFLPPYKTHIHTHTSQIDVPSTNTSPPP